LELGGEVVLVGRNFRPCGLEASFFLWVELGVLLEGVQRVRLRREVVRRLLELLLLELLIVALVRIHNLVVILCRAVGWHVSQIRRIV
jgi:hypothetical protein